MKKALEYIVSLVVEKPEKVKIEEQEQDNITNFTIHVAEEDMGRIIGKNGKVIRSIRNVIKIPAIKQNKKINVIIAESSS